MNQKDRNEVVQILVVGFDRKLTKPERRRLAELTGYYMQEKKGAPPREKRGLPRISESNFRTAAAFKELAEKILGRTIWVTPSWKEGYPKGKQRSLAAKARQEERANANLDGKSLSDMVEVRGDEKAYRSAYNAVSRDVAAARPRILNEALHKATYNTVISDIANGMAAILRRSIPPTE